MNVNPETPRILPKTDSSKPRESRIKMTVSSRSTIKTSRVSNKILVSIENLPNKSTASVQKPVSIKNEGLLTEIMGEVNKITDQVTSNEIEAVLKETNKDLPKVPRVQTGESMTLYRGCRPDQLAKMLVAGSAGGLPVNPNTGKPTENAAVMQVGERESIPEFTSSSGVSKSFGKANIVIAVSIKKSYLRQGSGVECGMVCNPDAPIKLLAWRPGAKFDFPVVNENSGDLNHHKIIEEKELS